MVIKLTKYGKSLGIIKWAISGIVFVITIIFTYFSFRKEEGFADIGTLLILGFTLAALIFYAFSTYEISEVNKGTYEESKLPVVSLKIIPEPEKETSKKLGNLPSGVQFPDHLKNKINYDPEKKVLIFKGVMEEKEKEELLKLSRDTSYQDVVGSLFDESQYDTRVILRNFSNNNVEAFVNLNLKVDGNLIKYSEDYSGKKSWFLTARQLINGHFYIGDVLAKASTNVEKMKQAYSQANNVKRQLSMAIDVRFRGFLDNSKHPTKYTDRYTKWLGNPTQEWYFNFSEDVWVYDLYDL